VKELALHILDIAQNSIRAGAGEIRISITESSADDLLTIVISDDGRGMDEETLQKAADPFFTSRKTRRVGLGLPLLSMNASLSGGEMKITSSPGAGTTVTAVFRLSHIDRPPVGDIGGTVSFLITANPSINIAYMYSVDSQSWGVTTQEIREALGTTSITELKVVRYLREMITENTNELTNTKCGHDKY
jgi:anti-sigma regulatory factor (Ser/Thr protein kinase)